MDFEDYIPLIQIFKKIPEQRQEAKVLHSLVDIIFIAIVSTLAGAEDWTDMEDFATKREEWFRKYIPLRNGIPSHDTIQRVFQWIPPKKFLQCFIEWTQMIACIAKGGIVAIDGKTMRRTFDSLTGKKALHIVSAWFSENKIVLGQYATDEKSNEITAIPELLDLLDITGCIVTVDAMGTQKEIAEKIVGKKADYVMALKGNHRLLYEEVKGFFGEIKTPKDLQEYEVEKHEEIEKGHGRIETRQYYLVRQINWLDAREDWKELEAIGMVVYTSEKSGQNVMETRYYLTSIKDIQKFANAARSHWGVESMHWTLDVTFNEDKKRTRKDNSPENLALLLRWAYNILKLDKSNKKSLRRKRLEAGWDMNYLEKILANLSQ